MILQSPHEFALVVYPALFIFVFIVLNRCLDNMNAKAGIDSDNQSKKLN